MLCCAILINEINNYIIAPINILNIFMLFETHMACAILELVDRIGISLI